MSFHKNNRQTFPIKYTYYHCLFITGIEIELAIRLGFSYDPNYAESSLYVGPFRFWFCHRRI